MEKVVERAIYKAVYKGICKYPMTFYFVNALLLCFFLEGNYQNEEEYLQLLLMFRIESLALTAILLSIFLDMIGPRIFRWSFRQRITAYIFELVFITIYYEHITQYEEMIFFPGKIMVSFILISALAILKFVLSDKNRAAIAAILFIMAAYILRLLYLIAYSISNQFAGKLHMLPAPAGFPLFYKFSIIYISILIIILNAKKVVSRQNNVLVITLQYFVVPVSAVYLIFMRVFIYKDAPYSFGIAGEVLVFLPALLAINVLAGDLAKRRPLKKTFSPVMETLYYMLILANTVTLFIYELVNVLKCGTPENSLAFALSICPVAVISLKLFNKIKNGEKVLFFIVMSFLLFVCLMLGASN